MEITSLQYIKGTQCCADGLDWRYPSPLFNIHLVFVFTKWKYNASVIDTTTREQQKHTETTITEDISHLAKYRKDHKTCLLYSVPVIILDLYRVSVATCPVVAPTTMLHIPVPAIYLLIHNTVNDFCSPIFIVPVLASTRKCINCAKEKKKKKKILRNWISNNRSENHFAASVSNKSRN